MHEAAEANNGRASAAEANGGCSSCCRSRSMAVEAKQEAAAVQLSCGTPDIIKTKSGDACTPWNTQQKPACSTNCHHKRFRCRAPHQARQETVMHLVILWPRPPPFSLAMLVQTSAITCSSGFMPHLVSHRAERVVLQR